MSSAAPTPSEVPAASPEDPSWLLYPETVLEFGDPCRLRIDLRAPIDSDSRAGLAALGMDGPFAVVTAFNPGGHEAEADENARRAATLDIEVAAIAATALRADGVCGEGLHRECGWALAIGLEAAGDLAERHGQSAIFWFDGRRFFIVPVLERRASTITLPQRPATGVVE